MCVCCGVVGFGKEIRGSGCESLLIVLKMGGTTVLEAGMDVVGKEEGE